MTATEQSYFPIGRALQALEVLARLPPLVRIAVKFRLNDDEIRLVAFVARVLLDIGELPPAVRLESETYLGLAEFERRPLSLDALTRELARSTCDPVTARSLMPIFVAREHPAADQVRTLATLKRRAIEFAELSPEQRRTVESFFELDSEDDIARACRDV